MTFGAGQTEETSQPQKADRSFTYLLLWRSATNDNRYMPEFDWVTARTECSAQGVFFRLVAGIKADVATRNNLALLDNSNLHFEVAEIGNVVLVTRLEGSDTKKVEITFAAGGFKTEGYGPQLIGIPTFNAKAECVVMVNGEEMQLWQFRCRALETLLFSSKAITEITAGKR